MILWTRKPDPLTEANTQLSEAQIALLEMAKNAEYYGAMVVMLRNRIERLQNTVKVMSKSPYTNSDDPVCGGPILNA